MSIIVHNSEKKKKDHKQEKDFLIENDYSLFLGRNNNLQPKRLEWGIDLKKLQNQKKRN